MLKYEALLGRLLLYAYIQVPSLLASTGRAGNLIYSVALCNGMSLSVSVSVSVRRRVVEG